MANDENEERVGMSVEGGGADLGLFGLHSPRFNAPVHEQMTIAALINSDYRLDSSLTFIKLRDNPKANPPLNDFIRGVIWNDDPECELFNDVPDNNLSYGLAADWLKKFGLGYISGDSDRTQLIRRSHFGDMQWLHGMSSVKGEAPSDTKKSVLRWFETIYKLATGVISSDTSIQDTWLRDWLDDPSHYKTLGQLLTHGHQASANIQNRAIASCFHIIQDSYAIGHTRREPKNPGDRVPGDGLKYRDGVADRWGSILNFHTYSGQGHDHAHYDHSKDGSVENLDLRNLDSWNGLIGCRDGLDACIILANYWVRKADWNEVYTWLDTKVFELSTNATPGDNTVT